MSDQIFLEGKDYVSSKKAAVTSGYAQDYIGQLARSGAIDAQRVGGLWYVRMESLSDYQRNAASYSPVQPVKTSPELDSIVSFDGKEYMSASRAAKTTGYHQDYIGQLARSGKILSRQIGNRWYIEKDALTTHKAEKDRLLAAVQVEAVGIVHPETNPVQERPAVPLLNYFKEEGDLMPAPTPRAQSHTADPSLTASPNMIPIRRMPTQPAIAPVRSHVSVAASQPRAPRPRLKSGTTIARAAEFGIAFTFVLVLSYGLVTLKSHSTYAVNIKSGVERIGAGALTANAATAFDALTASIERLINPELLYERS